MSTWLCLASAKTTRSTAGRSTPSPSTRQLVTIDMLGVMAPSFAVLSITTLSTDAISSVAAPPVVAPSVGITARLTGSSAASLLCVSIVPLTRLRVMPREASVALATFSSAAARALVEQNTKAVRAP